MIEETRGEPDDAVRGEAGAIATPEADMTEDAAPAWNAAPDAEIGADPAAASGSAPERRNVAPNRR